MNKDAKIVLLIVFILVMLGIVMIFSSSAVYAYNKYSDSLFFVKKHLLYLCFSAFFALLSMALSIDFLKANARLIIFLFIFLLILVLIPGIGKQIAGARRWFRFFGFSLQPSELSKIAVIIYFSSVIAHKKYIIKSFKYVFLPLLFVLGLISGLILLEPDLGTCVSIVFIGFILLFISDVQLKYLFSICGFTIPLLIFAIMYAPYRMKRVIAFLNPWEDAKGSGFQLIQSFIALGSGGLFGVGLGASKQKLFYLPESHTDFIFSIIGEELGFLGSIFVIILFGLFIFFSLRIAFKIKDIFASRIVFGIASMVGFEVFVNIGVSTGLLPTKGLTLPFISYGGTSLLSHFIAVGLILNMSRKVE